MHFWYLFRYFAFNMKSLFYISLLLYGFVAFSACTGPVILEEPHDSEDGKVETGIGPGDEPHVRDSVPIMHEGTYSSPYTIGEALTLGRGKSVWVEGYIVGCCETTTMKSGNNYKSTAMTKSNILLADTFLTGKEYDYLYCLAIKLPNNSTERDDLNLYDNPDNYHRRVRIHGDITLYLKGIGMENIYSYALANHETEDENGEEDEDMEERPNEDEEWNDPETPYDPDATRQDTLSIAEGIRLQDRGEQPYIRGYIVGFYNGSSFVFNPTEGPISSRANNNVLLADNVGETDWNKVIIVELPAKTVLRENVNLYENPDNLYHRLTVKGMLREYKEDTGYHGCMGTLSGLGDDEGYYFFLE